MPSAPALAPSLEAAAPARVGPAEALPEQLREPREQPEAAAALAQERVVPVVVVPVALPEAWQEERPGVSPVAAVARRAAWLELEAPAGVGVALLLLLRRAP